jgi:hypothetical protein
VNTHASPDCGYFACRLYCTGPLPAGNCGPILYGVVYVAGVALAALVTVGCAFAAWRALR